MKYIKGYRHYHNNKYSTHNNSKSSFSKVVESSYIDFLNKGKSSSHYFDLGKKDSRNIFEIILSDSEYQFLKENIKLEEINSILMESISLVISLSDNDSINEGLLDGIKKKIGDSYDKAVNWVDDKIDKAVELGKVAVKKMKDIIANITDIVSNLYKQTKDALTQMWAFLGTQFSKLIDKMKGGVKKAGNAKVKALISVLEADNMAKETEEAKKDLSKIRQMVTGARLAKQSDVEATMAAKAEDFKDYSADELEKTVINDVTTVQAESVINLMKGLVLENGASSLYDLSESLKVGSSLDAINEKDGVSSKSIFSWVLEGVSVIISWKSKLIEKLTKVGTNFLMNFMSNVARAGQGMKYVLMGQVVAFVIALIYESMHLIHEVGHDVGHAAPAHESKINEADEQNTEVKTEQKPDPNVVKKPEQKVDQKQDQQNTQNAQQKPVDQKDQQQENTEKEQTDESGKVKELVKNINMDSLSPDKIISAIDWKALKFAGLSIVFTLAIKTLFPQLSLLFTIIGVVVCSFELIESVCTISKSHKGVCAAIHEVEHFANGLFKGQASPAH